jgi:hypothetical protein
MESYLRQANPVIQYLTKSYTEKPGEKFRGDALKDGRTHGFRRKVFKRFIAGSPNRG